MGGRRGGGGGRDSQGMERAARLLLVGIAGGTKPCWAPCPSASAGLLAMRCTSSSPFHPTPQSQPHLGLELDLGRLEGVVWREVDGNEKHAAGVGAVAGTHDGGLRERRWGAGGWTARATWGVGLPGTTPARRDASLPASGRDHLRQGQRCMMSADPFASPAGRQVGEGKDGLRAQGHSRLIRVTASQYPMHLQLLLNALGSHVPALVSEEVRAQPRRFEGLGSCGTGENFAFGNTNTTSG